MEGLRESQRAQDEGALPPGDGLVLPTPIITSQVDNFLQVGLKEGRKEGRWGEGRLTFFERRKEGLVAGVGPVSNAARIRVQTKPSHNYLRLPKSPSTNEPIS
jgi:hypothetical protein